MKNLSPSSQNQIDAKKKYLKYIMGESGKLIPNPDFDPNYVSYVNQKSLEKNINDLKALAIDKNNYVFNGESSVVVTPTPKTKEEYVKEDTKFREILGRLSYIKNPKAREKLALRDYALSKLPWIYNKQAINRARENQNNKALSTPVFYDSHLSEEKIALAINDIGNRKGKNKETRNAAIRIIIELFNIGRLGKFLQVSAKYLAKVLLLNVRTISRGIALLEELNLLVREGSHLCTNIYQLTSHLLKSKVQSLLASFASGRQADLLKHVLHKALSYIYNTINSTNISIKEGETNNISLEESISFENFKKSLCM